MLAKKVVVCALLFAALLACGRLAEREVLERRTAAPSAYRTLEQGLAIVRANAYPAFRSREYVKIIRQLERLDRQERSP
ncbi:hypothetical protein [Paenibacillus sp.]|uniref:hypothetical protein n=1 Tax=Paenibacillus sp. TaxID=58172 RepID=UPI002812787A|nr:hypothetical protein [Paenibacillus sp.]